MVAADAFRFFDGEGVTGGVTTTVTGLSVSCLDKNNNDEEVVDDGMTIDDSKHPRDCEMACTGSCLFLSNKRGDCRRIIRWWERVSSKL